MPTRPWYPHNVGDYDRKTKLLTLEQHGAYRALLDYAWDNDGVVPGDPRELGRIWKVHTNRAKILWKTIGGFWYETQGGFRNKRVDKELQQAAESYEKRASAGRKGGLSNAQAMLKHPQPHTTERKETSPSERQRKERSTRGTRLPSDWAPPPEYLQWARENGNGLDLDFEVAEFRDFWSSRAGRDSTKIDWFATWRNHIRKRAKGHRSGPQTSQTPAQRFLEITKAKRGTL